MCLSFGRSFIPANGSTMSTQQRITEPVVDPACESLRIKAQKGDHPRYRLMPSSFSKPRASASDQLLAVIELSYPDSASQSFFKEWVSNRELCLQSPREDCRSQHHRIVATHALGVAAILECVSVCAANPELSRNSCIEIEVRGTANRFIEAA